MRQHINALSVDVEDYFHVAALAESIPISNWDNMEYRCEHSTNQLLSLFAEYDVKATFFVLGWVAKRSPALVRKISKLGHEVACHGLSHQLVYEQTPAQFRDETISAKALLEDVTGGAVEGYRAASWSITEKSQWALDVIVEAGFRYDSSVFPVHHDRYGIPGAPTRPGLMTTPGGHCLVEFPPSTTRLLGQNIPVSGGGYFRLFPYWLTRTLLKRVSGDGPFMFYLHPWEVDTGQPRIKASWFSEFRHYNNIDKTDSRLRALLDDFRFTTVMDVLNRNGLLDGER